MQRICFLLKVKQHLLEEYKETHRNVWPEMKQALSETGWTNYSLFLRDDGMLIGYLETENFDQARAKLAQSAANLRWQSHMAPYFEQLDGQRPDEGLLVLPSIFYLS